MKNVNIKLLLAITIGLFALTKAKAQDVVSRPTQFNQWVAFAQNHPGTSANRLMGVSAAQGLKGNYMNYVYIGSGLTLSGDSLKVSGTGSGAPWLITGNTITGNRWLGTNNNRSLHVRTNGIEYLLLDSLGNFRAGASNTLPLFNSTAQNQTHLATAGSYTIRTTTGNIVLNATSSQAVNIGTVTGPQKLNVLGNSYFNGDVGIGIGNPLYKLQVDGSFYTKFLNGSKKYITENTAGAGGFSASIVDTVTGENINLSITEYALGCLATDGGSNSTFLNQQSNTLSFTDNGSNTFFTVKNTGNTGIGTATPAAILDVVSTSSGVLLPRVTTGQRDAFATPANGMIIYNTTTDKFQGYAGGAWVDLN